MPDNCLERVYGKIQLTQCYLIGNHTVSTASRQDIAVIRNALCLWAGILLDHNSLLGLNDQVSRANRGRILSIQPFFGQKVVDLGQLLTYLDECDRTLILESSQSSRFKGESFLRKVKADPPLGCDGLVGLLTSSISQLVKGDVSDVTCVKLIHQSLCFMKKLEIDRPDLEDKANADFFEFEKELALRPPIGSNSEAEEVVKEMNALARLHLSSFDIAPVMPKHGPGVVADQSVKCWYDKNTSMSTDRRINYLLAKEGLGTINDYCPFCGMNNSTRTSRFISVPKTWKKLRGISAEPVELQFFQQAVFTSIDRLFCHDEWWRKRVDLHNQPRSRQLALIGSMTDSYATIDLSAASDSVTLELVKKVFKGTPLLKWLLATRSTYTECDGKTIKTNKFSPMGSACCFPVECIVFALATQVASDRTRTALDNCRETVCVFGDDIITDWYAAQECIRILELLGFKVNVEKSFIKGHFREACGAEAYHGYEIQPLRYKRISSSLMTTQISIGDAATVLSYCNSLYDRGYSITRRFLLGRFLRMKVLIGKKAVSLKRFLPVTFNGLRGTLASPSPTNFNITLAFDSFLQCKTVKTLGICFKPLLHTLRSEMSEQYSTMKYVEWLINHQDDQERTDERYSTSFHFLTETSEYDMRMPMGFVMVPCFNMGVWSHYDSLVI
mgnify:FL=1